MFRYKPKCDLIAYVLFSSTAGAPSLIQGSQSNSSRGSECLAQQKDVDKEFFLLYSVMDENESWYIDKNTQMYATLQTPVPEEEEEAITESNRMHGN